MLRSSLDLVDFKGLSFSQGEVGEIDFSIVKAQNLSLSNLVIETLVIPASPPTNVKLSDSVASRIVGVSAQSGLPDWIENVSADIYDSVQTVSRIRNAGLSPAHEFLVAVVKKTFFQKGAGRQEEALLRGFGQGPGQKTANAILGILMREKILDRFKGKEGWVYTPVRSKAARMDALLQQLRSSDDPLWAEVALL